MDASIVNEARLIGKVVNIIRGEQAYNMEKPIWKLCNKLFAAMSYGSYISSKIFIKLNFNKKVFRDMHFKGIQYYVEAAILNLMNVK